MSVEVYCDEPYMGIHWDGAARWIYLEWRSWATIDEVKSGVERGLQALSDHRGTKWLADSRRRRAIQAEVQEWLENSWLPRAAALGLKRLAMVLPKSEVARITVDDLVRKYSTQVETAVFGSLEEACAWLSSG